jgi:hypothetical protein
MVVAVSESIRSHVTLILLWNLACRRKKKSSISPIPIHRKRKVASHSYETIERVHRKERGDERVIEETRRKEEYKRTAISYVSHLVTSSTRLRLQFGKQFAPPLPRCGLWHFWPVTLLFATLTLLFGHRFESLPRWPRLRYDHASGASVMRPIKVLPTTGGPMPNGFRAIASGRGITDGSGTTGHPVKSAGWFSPAMAPPIASSVSIHFRR